MELQCHKISLRLVLFRTAELYSFVQLCCYEIEIFSSLTKWKVHMSGCELLNYI